MRFKLCRRSNFCIPPSSVCIYLKLCFEDCDFVLCGECSFWEKKTHNDSKALKPDFFNHRVIVDKGIKTTQTVYPMASIYHFTLDVRPNKHGKQSREPKKPNYPNVGVVNEVDMGLESKICCIILVYHYYNLL